jgi:geranylgeranyl pyrophosphate synthase
LSINLLFSGLVEKEIGQVEDLMRLPNDGDSPDLIVALEMVIAAGGKRIRPTVSLLVGRILDAQPGKLITMAAAIELLHNATLVHDDLIDGALLRRGSPTLNSKWSPGATVLTGDLLFARAAKLAADTNSVPAIKLFALTLTRIVGGEIDQLLNNNFLLSREAYFKRIYAKTGSLFETAASTAAMISPVKQEVVVDMANFGRKIGNAFQIIDDILDFTGEQVVVGKPLGSDLRQGLVTLPAIIYFEHHQGDRIVENLKTGKTPDAEELNQLVESIRASDSITEAHKEARQFVESGRKMLDQFIRSPGKEALNELALYIVDRNF